MNTEAMCQTADGNWVPATPLPNDYGAPIPESVRNDPVALEQIKVRTGGWDPHCVKCGEVARNIGLAVCNKCSLKHLVEKLNNFRRYYHAYLVNPDVSTGDFGEMHLDIEDEWELHRHGYRVFGKDWHDSSNDRPVDII